MDVIIIGSAYPLRGGGIATFNERLARAYIEKGDKIKIYTFSLQYPTFFFLEKHNILMKNLLWIWTLKFLLIL